MAFKGLIASLKNKSGYYSKRRSQMGMQDEGEEDELSEEGFVILENPCKEISTDRLPTHHQFMVTVSHQTQSARSSVSLPLSNDTSASLPESPSHKNFSPVNDVPFRLHPSLCTEQKWNQFFCTLDLRTKTFDPDKYTHDFKLERHCLKELE